MSGKLIAKLNFSINLKVENANSCGWPMFFGVITTNFTLLWTK